METNKCFDCGATFISNGFSTGYGTDREGNRVCFACCGIRDQKDMEKTGKATLYLTLKERPGLRLFADGEVGNWPGTLKLPCRVKRGRHNIAGVRFDAWFRFAGKDWHGVQYGENTQLIHCKQLKRVGHA